jgi:hypothetical protein
MTQKPRPQMVNCLVDAQKRDQQQKLLHISLLRALFTLFGSVREDIQMI